MDQRRTGTLSISDWDSGPISSPHDGKLITLVGWAIGASWVAASVAAAVSGRGLPPEQQPALRYYALGFHAYAQGPVLVHLFAYSFIHGIGAHLIFNLLALWFAVEMARRCLTPNALIRLYTLGVVSSGLVYLLVSQYVHNTLPLIGAGGAIMAVFGALAVINPGQRVRFFFVKEMRLPWAVVWLCVIQLLSIKSAPGLSLGMIAGLFAGIVHGVVERLWRPSQHA